MHGVKCFNLRYYCRFLRWSFTFLFYAACSCTRNSIRNNRNFCVLLYPFQL